VTLGIEYGQVSISQPASGPASICRLTISDTGVGIPQDKLEEVFEPFTQVKAHRTSVEGTGLGLAITRRLVDLMQGTLSVHSAVGTGSTFLVELPLPVVEQSAVVTKKKQGRIVGYTEERKRILIADDNITSLSMLVDLLEPLGFEIVTAADGREAIQQVRSFSPDLIITDFVMPDKDGLEIIRELRTDAELRDITCVGASATVVDKERKQAFIDACDTFLPKPVDLDELLKTLQHHLNLEWKRADMETAYESEYREAGEDHNFKTPPADILATLIHHAELGAYNELEQALTDLSDRDSEYTEFCRTLHAYIERYDDEGLLRCLNQHKGEHA